MRNLFLFVIASLSFAFTVHAHNDLVDALEELELVCKLGQHEVAVLEEVVSDGAAISSDFAIHKKDVIDSMINKLGECKTRIDNIVANSNGQCCESEDGHSWCSFKTLATGCDWFVRIAGVIWSLQVFYGLIF